jgi:hypothetical protein
VESKLTSAFQLLRKTNPWKIKLQTKKKFSGAISTAWSTPESVGVASTTSGTLTNNLI